MNKYVYDCSSHFYCSCGDDDPQALYIHRKSKRYFSLNPLTWFFEYYICRKRIYNPRLDKYEGIVKDTVFRIDDITDNFWS